MIWNPFSRAGKRGAAGERPGKVPIRIPSGEAEPEAARAPESDRGGARDAGVDSLAGAVGANLVVSAGAHASEATGAALPSRPGPVSPAGPGSSPPEPPPSSPGPGASDPERPPSPPAQRFSDRPVDAIRDEVIGVLRTVYDPEIPINVYELGLVYEINITPPGEVHIRMTLTSPACPVAGSLPPEVEHKVASIPGVTSVRVELVWDPPWSPSRMSEAARLQLNV